MITTYIAQYQNPPDRFDHLVRIKPENRWRDESEHKTLKAAENAIKNAKRLKVVYHMKTGFRIIKHIESNEIVKIIKHKPYKLTPKDIADYNR